MTPETNALIPVGIAALCFLLAFLYGRHRRALALRRRVAESFGQTPAEPERPRAMTREFGNSCAQASLPASASTTRPGTTWTWTTCSRALISAKAPWGVPAFMQCCTA